MVQRAAPGVWVFTSPLFSVRFSRSKVIVKKEYRIISDSVDWGHPVTLKSVLGPLAEIICKPDNLVVDSWELIHKDHWKLSLTAVLFLHVQFKTHVSCRSDTLGWSELLVFHKLGTAQHQTAPYWHILPSLSSCHDSYITGNVKARTDYSQENIPCGRYGIIHQFTISGQVFSLKNTMNCTYNLFIQSVSVHRA